MLLANRTSIAPILLIFTLLSCRQSDSLFKVMPASKTSIHFVNQLQNGSNLNIINYLYYYNGGGVAIGDVNNDGLPDIYFTANSKGNNKLYLNKGKIEFEDITSPAGVAGSADWCSGVTMADVNGDGYLDIYVSAVSNSNGLKGSNQIFLSIMVVPLLPLLKVLRSMDWTFQVFPPRQLFLIMMGMVTWIVFF